LPPLDALRAFEAAARRLSFTEAAEELHVTQGAISQRVKALELDLGTPLFRRLTRRLELTPDGERLARGVREGLDHIVGALAGIDRNAVAGALTISVLPSFASRWLMPRLPLFHALHPEVELYVLAAAQPVDLNLNGIDGAIRFGHGRYPGLRATYLMADSVAPVCAPGLLERYPPIRTVGDLAALPLLHDTPTESDPSMSDWASWLTHVGAPPIRFSSGLRFNQADLTIEAAVRGLGVALARTSLIGDDLAQRRLVFAYPRAAPTAYTYYFVCRPESHSCPRITHFREWLMAEARVTAGMPLAPC
jgi:LysR family glycine cleavage system transcriptional activator